MTIVSENVVSELKPLFLSRKNFYQLLHMFFLEPQEELLLDFGPNANLRELKELHEGGKILHQYFENLSEEKILQAKDEYQRLFIGPGPLVAPPWESYYRSKEKLLFDECTYQIRELYHQFGLQYIRENNEPDDHLLLELEFMIYLTDLTLNEDNFARLIELINTQIDLLNEHLLIWIPYFCKKIIENTNSELYLGAAMLLEDFLSFDLESLAEVREALTHV